MSSSFPRLALILTLLICVSFGSAWADPIDRPHVPGEFIIKFKAGTSDNVKELILSDLSAQHIRGFGRIKSALKRSGTLSVEQAIAMYGDHPNVEFIEPNYILTANELPDDTRFDELWGMHNTGQTGGTAGADISADMAWDVFTGNANIVVGVIDTGVDYNHVDLVDNAWTNPGEIAGNGIDDDGNGYIDDIHGWDWVNNDADPMDDNGHGTHCSGTIGGVGNNGTGVAGVNWTVRIMGLKFLSAGGSGSSADAVSAIEYATDMALRYPGEVRLTSNSWGGGGFSQALYDAIADAEAADMLFIAAAGNSSTNTDASPHYPSSYDLDNIIAVAATDHNDNLASFSSYGATTVDIAAPGVDILSTIPGNGYGLNSGTSMATPHVSGVAALTFGRFPAVSALDAKSLILNGADPLENLDGVVLTGGRLNAFWPIAEPDSIPPDPVVDLAVNQAGSNWLDVSWTATGDDGSTGTASRYDMRYSMSPIDELNFDSANLAMGEPDPGPPGTFESMRVDGLDFTTTYYVAVKVLDEFGNASLISNVVNGTTLGAPDISAAPLSMSEALLTGATSTQTLQLLNFTGGTLDFVIPTPTLLGDPVIANAYVPIPKGGVDTRMTGPTTLDSGGPDNFGYRWADSNDPFGPTFAWSDISGVGSTALSTGDDVSAGPFPIGFDFPFYGADFAEFNVCSNGFISLTSSATDYSNQPLPTAGAPAHMIAPFWDDLDVAAGTVFYHSDGTRLIVQWDAVSHYGSGGPYTFQALLYPDGTIEYQYLDMGAPDDSATVGWQNGDGSDGLHIVFNNTWVENNLAVQIKAIPQWVTVTPTEGTIFGAGSADLQVDFDASGLFGGTYEGYIRILSNDPDEPEFQVPVQLAVTGAPDITVEPLAYDFGSLFVGAIGETDIIIRNTGTDVLEVTSITIGDAAFVADVSGPFLLAPRQAQPVHVTFNPTLAQSYITTMTVASSDPDEGSIVVDLSGAGLEPPEFAIDPTSIAADLYTGDTETQVLTLTNSGGADFEWSMAVNLDADVTVYDVQDLPKGEVDTRPGILGAGGPDLYGYSWMDSDEPGGPTFDWVDITGIGTPVYSGNADDSNVGPFPIGFDFPFYGNDFSTFRVSSNGFISFTSTSSDLGNAPLPGTGAPENLLALLHDDMYVDADIPSQVFYHYDGARLIVQFNNIRRYGQSDSSPPFYDMEAILYPNGRIVYQYLTVEAGGNSGCTIGIQNATQDDGLTVVYNADYVHDNLAIRFDAAPEWLTVAPASGVIPPGGSADVTALFNAADLFGGTYTGDIHLVTNDPSVPTMDVPATLNVTGAPQMEVSATAIDFGSQFVGFPTPRNLVIANGGTDDLVISSALISAPEFLSNFTPPVTLGPTQALLIDLSFVPSSATTFNGTLTIESNDPSGGTVVVDLTGIGLIPPEASVTPTTLAADLFTGESEVQMVTLTNSGGSDLTFNVASQLSVASVPTYELPEDLAKGEDYALPGILGSGGPDTFGYSWMDSDEPGGPVFNWVDIGGTGAPLFTSYSDDGNRGPNPIGFTFPFYGNDFTEFRVCSNGWISFTSTSTDYTNAPLPGTGAPENLLAVFHDDLKVDPANGSQVFYEFDGEKLIVQYDNISRLGSGGPYTFQALLYPTGTIVYQYLSMAGTRLDEATIGIQNAARDDGLTVVYNADYVHDGLAIRLGTTPDWLTANPTDGIVPPGASANIQVTFDATGLFGGGYDGAVRIETNDPGAGLIAVPAHLDVTGIPMIAVDPVALDFGSVYLTQDNTLQLTVSNPGTQTLHVTGVTSDDPEITFDLAAFDVEPLQARVVNVTFTAVTVGTHNAVLSLTHDADGSPTDVAMTAVGVVPPEIVLDPTSLEAAAMPGTQKIKTITVCNEGGSDLNFSVGEAQDATSTQVYTELVLPKQVDEAGSEEPIDPRPGILGSGGPDLFGYTWIDSDDPAGPAFGWVDITAVGTPVPFPSYIIDGNVGPIPIGFDFPFYGETFSELNACNNGWMSFTSTSTAYSNQPLPNSGSSVPENMLAVFWDDMVYDEDDGNYAYYHNDGSRFIITYHVRRIAQFTPPFYEFQVILYPNGNIVYQYNILGTTVNTNTIGIQNGTKDDGLTVAFNNGSYVHEGLAVLFSAAPDWLAVEPASGVIPAGECMDLTVTFDATELDVGDYTGSITLTSNDITDPVVDVPVLFHVGTIDATDTDVDPNTLNLASNGKFITAFIELPVGYDPAEVVLATVLLNGTVPAESQAFSFDNDFNGNGIPDLQFKFDRSAVAAILPAGESVELVITGEVEDTTWFVATDYIRVINPTLKSPDGGEVLAAGGSYPLVWDNPAEWDVDHADIFWTPDDGETWYEIARDLTGTSFSWDVPADMTTENARLRVFVYDSQGMLGFDTSNEVFEVLGQVTGVTPDVRPVTFALAQNSPNPFNPRTVISFDLPRDEHVNVSIYDVKGRLVKTLVSEPMTYGTHQAVWEGHDNRGNRVATGVYYYRIVAGKFMQTKSMVLVK